MTITRRYRFPASHRLHTPELSDAENAKVYGKCNNPFGHGHDYVLEVTVAGAVDDNTGLIIPIPALDEFVQRHVLDLFASRNLNLDVPHFATLPPTTENVALVITSLVEQHWRDSFGHTGAHICRVHVQETDRNGFEVRVNTPPARAGINEMESEIVNV